MATYYAGIGPRFRLPIPIATKMVQLGERFANEGLVLRSGAAVGADTAFERGCDNVGGKKEIFLPWAQFNGHDSIFLEPPTAAFELIDTIWDDCKDRSHKVRSLFARNCQQILGPNLDSPSNFVVCWTPGGKIVGGTGRAIGIANYFNIPVVNLFVDLDNIDLIDF